MSKVKTVMVDDGGIISYPQNFKEVNNFASFGTNVDATFNNISTEGTINTKSINIYNGGLNFYKNSGEVMAGQNGSFASINSSGITSTGSLTIEQNYEYIAWEFKNGTIRNWNKYCDSTITTGNNDVDSGNGYSTINLTAKKYSKGSLTDSISIGLNGSTKTVKVSDNATVQLPANTTIGGVAPAMFGSDINGTLDTLDTRVLYTSCIKPDDDSSTEIVMDDYNFKVATNIGWELSDSYGNSISSSETSGIYINITSADPGVFSGTGIAQVLNESTALNKKLPTAKAVYDFVKSYSPTIDLSNYQTKLNYYSESVYDDGSSHVFIEADQTIIGDNTAHITLSQSRDGKYITIQNESEGGIYIESQNNISLNTSEEDFGASISVGDGRVFIRGDNNIVLDSLNGNIICHSPISAPVYTENTDGTYTKTNKTVALRVVERDGAYTIVID